jgi:hypothetical protein
MTIHRALLFSILMSAISIAGPALAQNCTRQGIDVSCDHGRRGILSGDTIIFADGIQSSLTSPHPSVIIGNKSSVIVGQASLSARATAWCRRKIRAIRTGRAALFSTAWRIAIRDSSFPDMQLHI